MSVYVIANLEIEDREEYQHYEAGFMAVLGDYQAKLLAVDEAQKPIEGDWAHTRTVLLQFASEAEVRRWYDSDAYQSIVKHRHAASRADIAIVRGIDEYGVAPSEER